MSATIKVIVCRIGEPAAIEEILPHIFRCIVGWSMEVFPVRLAPPVLAGYARDAGRYALPRNRAFSTVGMVHGDVVIFNADHDDERSVTEADLAWVEQDTAQATPRELAHSRWNE